MNYYNLLTIPLQLSIEKPDAISKVTHNNVATYFDKIQKPQYKIPNLAEFSH